MHMQRQHNSVKKYDYKPDNFNFFMFHNQKKGFLEKWCWFNGFLNWFHLVDGFLDEIPFSLIFIYLVEILGYESWFVVGVYDQSNKHVKDD